MIKGVIFDLDGVLVFTDSLHYKAWKKMADEEGIYFDETINLRLRGVSRIESLNIILEKATKTYSEEEKLELATRKNRYYVELLSSLSEDDVKAEDLEALKKLKEEGYLLAVGSSSKNTFLAPVLSAASTIAFFST